MKYKILFLVILFPVFARAQTITNSDTSAKRTIAEKVLKELTETWTLGVDSTGNNDAVNIRVYNRFKNLFDSSATVDEEFNAFYKYHFYRDSKKKNEISGIIKGVYEIDTLPKPFDIYAHDVALQVRKLKASVAGTPTFNFRNDYNEVIIGIKRIANAEKIRKYVVLDTAKYISDLINSRNPADTNRNKINSKLFDIIKKTADSVYQFRSEDSLQIIMSYYESAVDNDIVRTYKIKSIRRINNTLNCINEADRDFILDLEEDKDTAMSAMYMPGDFTARGLPDYDLDGVPDSADADNIDKCPGIFGTYRNHGCPENYFITNNKLDVFAGAQMNIAKINLPELNQLGYRDAAGSDLTDVLQSKKGGLKNPGLTAGLFAGISFSHYFGHKAKQSGISIGATYSGFSADYELSSTDPIIYTFRSNDGFYEYRRQIIINELKENITYKIFNFPVMYNFRWYGKMSAKEQKNDVDMRPSFNFKVGPSLMFFNASSDYNAVISFGGLYQTNGAQIVYEDYFDTTDINHHNIYITADSINIQNPNPGSDEIFNQLKENSANYDFANNKHYQGNEKNETRITIAINLGFDWQLQIRKAFAFKLGAHFVYAPLPERTKKYKPVDKTSDEFQSVYNSTAKTSYSAFGLNFGFVFRF